jgi:hypothetical protein
VKIKILIPEHQKLNPKLNSSHFESVYYNIKPNRFEHIWPTYICVVYNTRLVTIIVKPYKSILCHVELFKCKTLYLVLHSSLLILPYKTQP